VRRVSTRGTRRAEERDHAVRRGVAEAHGRGDRRRQRAPGEVRQQVERAARPVGAERDRHRDGARPGRERHRETQ
jgi:hypothetical protein